MPFSSRFSIFWTSFPEIRRFRRYANSPKPPPWPIYNIPGNWHLNGFYYTKQQQMANKFESRIYVVDDDPFCLATYDKHLKAEGYQHVHCFPSGADFLKELSNENGPEIVLLDHDLGDTTGLEILKEIKRFNNNIFVIFASSRRQPEIASESLKNGAFDYIIKDDSVLEHISATLSKLFIVQDYMKRKRLNKRFFLFSGLVLASCSLFSYLYEVLRSS
jgi:CheY-like chemotaxis protein